MQSSWCMLNCKECSTCIFCNIDGIKLIADCLKKSRNTNRERKSQDVDHTEMESMSESDEIMEPSSGTKMVRMEL